MSLGPGQTPGNNPPLRIFKQGIATAPSESTIPEDDSTAQATGGSGGGGWSPKFEFSKKKIKKKRLINSQELVQNTETARNTNKVLAESDKHNLLLKLQDESGDEEALATLLDHEEKTISMLIISIAKGL